MSLALDSLSLSLSHDDVFSPSNEEPELENGIRHLSVSSDGTIDSIVSVDETPTPPQSPTPVVHITPPSHRHSSISRDLMDNFTPEKKQQTNSFHTPELVRTAATIPSEVVLTPPTPPRLRTMRSSGSLSGGSHSSPESPGLLARRAANGKLPNKALISLQQMRFESNDAGMGLGVGPGSAGYEGLDSPSAPGSAGLTFRLALGLEGKEVKGATSPGAIAADDLENAPASPLGNAPTLLRQRSWGRSAPINRLPQTPDGIKIPPTLRGSKILDKLNLSPPPALSSPLSASPRDRTAFGLANGPPSPLVMRSSAFSSFGPNGPLTPLTPSHVPGAPALGGDVGYFSWNSFSDPASPGCPLPPDLAGAGQDDRNSLSPTRQGFFLTPLTPDTPPHRGGHMRMPMPASPLGRPESKNHNPFFAQA